MSAQASIAALLVIGCGVYAVWTLLPGVARRSIAGWLVQSPAPVPLPAGWIARLRTLASASSGCACDGCDKAMARTDGSARSAASDGLRPAQAAQPIRFHPPLRR